MPVFARVVSYFEEVAKRGSIRQAAEHLHVTASAVDRQILLLEERVGTPLFERMPRGVRLTSAGEILLGSIQQLSRDFDATILSLDALRGQRQGHVTIMGLQFLAERFFPDLIERSRERHPGISLSALVGSTEEVLHAVLAGDTDFGIAFAPAERLPVRVLCSATFRLGAVVAPSHPLGRSRNLDFTTCLEHALILPRRGMELRSRIERVQRLSAMAMRPTMETNSIALMKSVLKQGSELGFLTEADVAAEVGAGELLWIPLSDADMAPATIALLAPKWRGHSPAAAAIVDLLEAAIESLGRVTSRARKLRAKKRNATP
jgi:DNA-binding transcriptional LysR family regulator